VFLLWPQFCKKVWMLRLFAAYCMSVVYEGLVLQLIDLLQSAFAVYECLLCINTAFVAIIVYVNAYCVWMLSLLQSMFAVYEYLLCMSAEFVCDQYVLELIFVVIYVVYECWICYNQCLLCTNVCGLSLFATDICSDWCCCVWMQRLLRSMFAVYECWVCCDQYSL